MDSRRSWTARGFSVSLSLLLACGIAGSVLRAEEPPSPGEGEGVARESDAASDNTDDTTAPEPEDTVDSEPAPEPVLEPEPEQAETALPVPPFIEAVENEEWRPIAPLPAEFDWIQLVSGEWLKGEFIALYKEELEFDSDELDLLTLDWEKVIQVRTAYRMDVGLLRRGSATGKLWIEGSRVRVVDDDDVRQFDRSQIVSITRDARSEFKKWKGKVTIGLTVRQGNTDQIDFNSRANFQRRTIENRINIDYIANYNSIGGSDTANNQRANANWDKFLTDRFFVDPVIFEWYRDPFINISSRTTFSVGAGYQVIDSKRTDWYVSGGAGYQETHFESVQAGESDQTNTGALIIETDFDQDWTKSIEFIYSYRAQFTDKESGSYNHHMVMSFETEWTSVLDFDFTMMWDRTENPQPDANGVVPDKDDFRMIVGLGIEF